MNLNDERAPLLAEVRLEDVDKLFQSQELAEVFSRVTSNTQFKERLEAACSLFLKAIQEIKSLSDGKEKIEEEEAVAYLKRSVYANIKVNALSEALPDIIFRKKAVEDAVIHYIDQKLAMEILEGTTEAAMNRCKKIVTRHLLADVMLEGLASMF